MKFGEYLKAARERAELGINELGKISGVDPGYLSRLERGLVKPPLPDVIAKVAKGLKIPRNDLMHTAGYIDLPEDVKAAGVAYVALTDEYIKKGLTEDEIRQTLDAVLAYVKSKKVE